jgi:hypothetical protein
VGDSASAFLSHSEGGEPDRVTLKRVSVNEKVVLGTAGNFKKLVMLQLKIRMWGGSRMISKTDR